ncbi:hypothetical protein WN944_005747 [Citrus x changshan-huyou]|uniref:Uncharacterized protein n=1 Tax=Citrus x changshan-huyou TaxID=2935761 RepID=A0AAP0MJS2_9ROSI
MKIQVQVEFVNRDSEGQSKLDADGPARTLVLFSGGSPLIHQLAGSINANLSTIGFRRTHDFNKLDFQKEKNGNRLKAKMRRRLKESDNDVLKNSVFYNRML